MTNDIAVSLPTQRSVGSARIPGAEAARAAEQGMVGSPRAIYVHMPFCTHKCHYCDFYSIVDTQDRQAAYTDRLLREIDAWSPAARQPIETIFVGGGTPSLLRPGLWERVLSALHERFDLSGMGRGTGEFTVECNPETVTSELAGVLAEGGVNRASLGAQSFHRQHLKTLERRHDPEGLPSAVEALRTAGIECISVDLISGVPGQTLEDWDSDLETALTLGTSHISAYTLTYEPGTAMTARLARGEFNKATDDHEADLYEHTVRVLRDRGLDRYEVSNYAKPGDECRHNLAYWRQNDWLALGPSASGHAHGWRWKNTPRLDDYLQGDDAGFAPVSEIEPPDARRSLMDLLMTGIRLREGIDGADMLDRAGHLAVRADLERAVAFCTNQDWLECENDRWMLSDGGFLFADRVAAEMIGAVSDPDSISDSVSGSG